MDLSRAVIVATTDEDVRETVICFCCFAHVKLGAAGRLMLGKMCYELSTLFVAASSNITYCNYVLCSVRIVHSSNLLHDAKKRNIVSYDMCNNCVLNSV